jgi:hypothetical protein
MKVGQTHMDTMPVQPVDVNIEQTHPTEHVLYTEDVKQHEVPVLANAVQVETSDINTSAPDQMSEFAELESEFDGLLTTENVTQHEAIETVSHDLVSALLDADEESLAGDHEFDLSTVPKGKDKLNAQYTVKQLKALSRQLKLKSKGNKTDLINRIYEKLN